GTWDSTFAPVTCELPLLHQPSPYFPTPPFQTRVPQNDPAVPTVRLAQQPNGILVLAGAFDSVNGQARRRLARLEPDGALRGKPNLGLTRGPNPSLVAPPEIEVPYQIETSTDLLHWSEWLINEYPWWSWEISLPNDAPARFFRMQPLPSAAVSE
ncbi:MAG TPA: delta-60 repeat domain-containing protein, partial [Clostridia bacterium]|nr:delta-60 repeat domain-containing protein [Clostridia bacterium]